MTRSPRRIGVVLLAPTATAAAASGPGEASTGPLQRPPKPAASRLPAESSATVANPWTPSTVGGDVPPGALTIRRGAISGFFSGIAPTESAPGPGDKFVGLTTVTGGYGIAAGPDAFIASDSTTTTGGGEAGIAAGGSNDTIVNNTTVNNTTVAINSNGEGDHIEDNKVTDIVFAGNNEVIAHNSLTGTVADYEIAAWQHEQITDNTANSIQLDGISNSVVAHNTVTGRGVLDHLRERSG
jgi:hypothetical protein